MVSPSLRSKIILLFVTIVILFVALEGFFRLFGLGPLKVYRFSETRLFEYEPSQTAYTNYHREPIYINSYGIREDDIPLKASDGVYTILVVGDSTSFGYGIALEDTYVKRLEHMLNKASQSTEYRVINGAINKYNTVQERIFLEEIGLLYEPDLVMVGFSLNDLSLGPFGNAEDGPVAEKALDSYRSQIARQKLVKKSALVSYLYLMYAAWREGGDTSTINEGFKDLAETVSAREQDNGAQVQKKWERVIREYSKILEIARTNGFELAVAYVPYRFALDWPAEQFSRVDDEFKAFQQQTGVVYINPLSDLKKSEADLFLPNDPIHMDADGFEIVADVIFRALSR